MIQMEVPYGPGVASEKFLGALVMKFLGALVIPEGVFETVESLVMAAFWLYGAQRPRPHGYLKHWTYPWEELKKEHPFQGDDEPWTVLLREAYALTITHQLVN